MLELARYGRVLVLLDACHSGATTMDGTAIAVDVDALRTGLAAANVTVLTSSKGSETSEERESWQHGAFIKALLDSFNACYRSCGSSRPPGSPRCASLPRR